MSLRSPLFNQIKRKRVGAGQRGSSNPYVTARELLKASMSDIPDKGTESGGFVCDTSGESDAKKIRETEKETISPFVRAPAAGASTVSPSKGGRGVSKKQQKLAEAAKSSHNIFQYFQKKLPEQTKCEEEETKCEEEEAPNEAESAIVDSTAAVSQENGWQQRSPSSPVASDTEETKTEVMVIADDEEEKPLKVVQESSGQDMILTSE